MPGCAAVGCNNRSEKGYIMKCFPRDPKLRKIWQERVARADWEPSNNSFLCHVHFEPEEWCVTQSGRIRLRKNAVPSIFTVTSTRKSPRKRTKLARINNENEYENDYMTEYLENDTDHSSTGHLEEKDSDSQDIDDPSVLSFLYQRGNGSPKVIENVQISHRQHKDITNDVQQANTISIPDDNNEMNDNIRECDGEQQLDVRNKKSTDKQNEDVMKTKMKQEIDQTLFDDSYDEIEEKLKQICDGYREENISNNTEKLSTISRNQKGVLEKSVTQIPFHRSINYKYSSRNEIGNMLTDDMENIEIIFGSESGEDGAHISKDISYNNGATNLIDKLDQHIDRITNNKEIQKTSLEDINESLNGGNIHTMPNMTAAMKRKQRSREEIMESIKRSIQTTSSHDTNSLSDSDILDNIMEVENEIGKEINTSECIRFNKNDTTPAVTKFTIKVTGERDDVIDIMQDLFKGTKDFTIQEYDNAYVQQGNNSLVTSVITIDDYPVEANAKIECNDILSTSITSIGNEQTSHLSSLRSDECLSTKLMSHFDEKLNDLDINSSLTLNINNVNEQRTAIKYQFRKLQQKVKMQENVIKKLTNQLILYKGLEKDLRNKNLALEVKMKKMENMMYESNTKTETSTSPSMNYKKNVDLRQRRIDDLSNRVSYFNEMNKKLMKNVTVECQQKRKLESQVKQRDNKLKELNWKLEKASKYLERAEKNTNTYRRKMLNMQTFMRRKKLLDEKMSKFNEMLIDSMKKGYSEKALAMASEIKDICGTTGYDKLLNFGFPLPALSVLRTPSSDNFSDINQSNNEISRSIPLKNSTNGEHDIQCMKNNMKVNTKDQSEISRSVRDEIVLDNTETITGTVQDIFEESNNVDDFSTNQLKEHFILQLK